MCIVCVCDMHIYITIHIYIYIADNQRGAHTVPYPGVSKYEKLFPAWLVSSVPWSLSANAQSLSNPMPFVACWIVPELTEARIVVYAR